MNAAGGIKAKGGLGSRSSPATPRASRTTPGRRRSASSPPAPILPAHSTRLHRRHGPARPAKARAVPGRHRRRRSHQANVAKSVKEGQQKVQYVYRNFSDRLLGRKAVQYFTEIFADAKVSEARRSHVLERPLRPDSGPASWPRKGGQSRRGSWWRPLRCPSCPRPVHRGLEGKSLKPDIIAPIAGPPARMLLLPEIAQAARRADGHHQPGQPRASTRRADRRAQGRSSTLDSVPWPNFKTPGPVGSPRSTASARAARPSTPTPSTLRRLLVMADVLERAETAEPTPSWRRSKRRIHGRPHGIGGPVVFNEVGDNPNTSTAMIQIREQKPQVIWPKDAAQTRYVFPAKR